MCSEHDPELPLVNRETRVRDVYIFEVRTHLVLILVGHLNALSRSKQISASDSVQILLRLVSRGPCSNSLLSRLCGVLVVLTIEESGVELK